MSVPEILLPEVVVRLFWAVVIIAAGLSLYRLTNHIILRRAQKNAGAAQDFGLPLERKGIPAILYFTSPDCGPCRTIQRPALRRLQDRLGDRLQVIEVNTQEQPDLASRWGVLSVPTTFIIDQHGQLRHVNHGATRVEKLLQQLNQL